jgi:hypothetical protein
MFIGKIVGKLGGIFTQYKKRIGSVLLTTDNEVLVTTDNEILTFK